MRNRLLVLMPFALTLLFALVQAHWTGQSRVYDVLIVLTVVKLAGSAGFVGALLRFRFGEYMHSAWALLAGQLAILAFKDLLFGKLVHLPGLSAEQCLHVREGCSIVANAMFIVAMVLMAWVWRVAGFELPRVARHAAR